MSLSITKTILTRGSRCWKVSSEKTARIRAEMLFPFRGCSNTTSGKGDSSSKPSASNKEFSPSHTSFSPPPANDQDRPMFVTPPASEARQMTTAEGLEYGKLNLSQENMIVDTHALVKAFEARGFTGGQAECITYTFTQLMNDALREQRKVCVEKAALDVSREQIMAHIAALRKDMAILEKSELASLRNENDKLKLLLSQTKSQITEDVSRVKSQLTLDINIERSRAKEDFTMTEKSISSLTNKMTKELGVLETTFERYKNDIYKFIAGTLASAITIGLGIYRIWKS